MSEVCTDNRYEVIAAYKKKLMERTNIETSPDEMAVIDNVLFRFWQLGWLPPVPHGKLIDADVLEAEFEKLIAQDNWYYNALHHAPTIIRAEEDET